MQFQLARQRRSLQLPRDADKFYSSGSGADELASHSSRSGGITTIKQKYSSSRRGRVKNLYSARRATQKDSEETRVNL